MFLLRVNDAFNAVVNVVVKVAVDVVIASLLEMVVSAVVDVVFNARLAWGGGTGTLCGPPLLVLRVR